MTPDQKLKQAQDDLRRAERAVQEARDELAREKPRFTEADIAHGDMFYSPVYKNHVAVHRDKYLGSNQERYYITGDSEDSSCWYRNGPFTLAELVDVLNTSAGMWVKTPGKWVFQPESGRA